MKPSEPAAWISMAVASRRVDGLEEAIALLEEGQKQFPEHPLFPYNLACYYCCSGHLAAARSLLRLALEMEAGLRDVALNDEDLEVLHDEIRSGQMDTGETGNT